VCRRAVRLIPRSRSLTVLGLTRAAPASSSCVSPASIRRRRRTNPNPVVGHCVTGLPPFPRPAHAGHVASRPHTATVMPTPLPASHPPPPAARYASPQPVARQHSAWRLGVDAQLSSPVGELS